MRWRLAARAGSSLLLDVNVGGPPCDAVTAVEVDETPASIVITVHAGRTPGANCRAGTPALLGSYRVQATARAAGGAQGPRWRARRLTAGVALQRESLVERRRSDFGRLAGAGVPGR